MIAIDTSALVAILQGEPEAMRLRERLAAADSLVMSAGTAAEALILGGQRGFRSVLEAMIDAFGVEVVPLAPDDVGKVADAYLRWGKGNHPAGLNFGDCFAYALARARGCPLLYVGGDFARTDIEPA